MFFDDETRATRTGDGHWEGQLSGAWNIGDNPNGGYLVSCVTSVMAEVLPHPDPLTLTTHYLRPGVAEAPYTIEVDVVREGRTLSTARGRLIQEGKPRIEVLASFADLTTGAGIDRDLVIPAPTLPPPDTCVQRSGDLQRIALPITSRLDTRLHPGQVEAGAFGEPEMSGWIRFADGRAPDTRALPLFADAFPPSVASSLGVVGWVPTIELTVHLRRRPVPGFIQSRFRTEDLHKGRMVESGCLWDENGALVAQCRQIGLVTKAD